MKNILITGGAGFIGLNLAVQFLNKEYNVVVVDDLKNSYKKHINKLLKQFNNLTFYKGDVCDYNFMENVFKLHSFDTIIHLSAKKYIFVSFKHKRLYMKNNMESLDVVLKLASIFKIKKFMFASSVTVYGNNESKNIKETESYAPISPYALTKVMGEEKIMEWHKQNKDVGVIIFRFTNPCGANIKYMLGDNAKSKKLSLVAYIVNNALNNVPLKFNGNNHNTFDGTPVRDYIHIVDLANIVFNVLNNVKDGKLEILNVGCGGNGYSVLQILSAVEKVLECKIDYCFIDKKQGDVARLVCDNTKLKSTYNIYPTLNICDIVKDEIEFRKYINKK